MKIKRLVTQEGNPIYSNGRFKFSLVQGVHGGFNYWNPVITHVDHIASAADIFKKASGALNVPLKWSEEETISCVPI